MLRGVLTFLATMIGAAAGELPAGAVHWNAAMIEGLRTDGLDVEDPVAVFSAVFAALPDEVVVHPSENYHYWVLHAGGRTLRGNLRLASGRRERGELSVGYTEVTAHGPDESPPGVPPPLERHRWLDRRDGLELTCPGPLEAVAVWRGKRVKFRLAALDQTPPPASRLRPGEVFVQRTCDESGLRFLLLCDERRRAFVWVLDESSGSGEARDAMGGGLECGRRTGFIFWRDAQAGGRLVLAAVRRESVARNDWHDGPFDQLADNYADQTGIRERMIQVVPSLAGRIDRFGYFTDDPSRGRFAVVPYALYRRPAAVQRWLEAARGRELEAMHKAQGTALEETAGPDGE